MILSLGQDSHFSYPYVICLGTPIDKKTFLHRAKVKPGTYAGDLLAGVYDAIFHRSLELKRDYVEYYAVEYPTFSEYLRKRFRFTADTIRKISDQQSGSRQIIYFKPSYTFLEDDYGYEFLERLLEPTGK